MVTRDTAWADGTPCWVDLAVDDIGRACTFYASLFGWQAQPGPPEAGGYTICLKDGHTVAGIGPKPMDNMPSVWTTYIASSDVNATADAIKAASGQIIQEPMDVMDAGRLAVASDPGGAVFGVWEPGSHKGIGLANVAGSLVWNENMSRDYEGNKAFYRTVFGYEYGDAGGPGYATLKLAGHDVGGIGELGSDAPAEVPAHWMAYFGVPDIGAAISKVTSGGGSVMRQPWDTPYGRMTVVTDDQGAVFSLIGISAKNG